MIILTSYRKNSDRHDFDKPEVMFLFQMYEVNAYFYYNFYW